MKKWFCEKSDEELLTFLFNEIIDYEREDDIFPSCISKKTLDKWAEMVVILTSNIADKKEIEYDHYDNYLGTLKKNTICNPSKLVSIINDLRPQILDLIRKEFCEIVDLNNLD